MNLYCTPPEYIGAFGAMAFGGAAIACFFLPVLGDKYGRFSVYIVTTILQIPLFVVTNLTTSLAPVYVITFYFGVALIGRFTCGFVLMTECLCKKHRALVGTALLTGDAAATLYVTFLLRVVTNNAQTIIWIGLSLNVASVLLSYFNVESP